jgi:hypothetical protein
MASTTGGGSYYCYYGDKADYVFIEAYRCYHLLTKFHPAYLGKVNSTLDKLLGIINIEFEETV